MLEPPLVVSPRCSVLCCGRCAPPGAVTGYVRLWAQTRPASMARAAPAAALTCDLDPAPGGRRPRGRGQSAAHTDVLDARCGFPGSLTLGPPALPPLGATPCHAHGPRKHRAARVCHTPRGAEGGLQRCGQRRCSPSPRAAARLCVRRLSCWFQLLESSAFVVAGDYERGGLAAHTCPPLRGSAAQGLAAIYTTSGPWMASGASSATTVPPTSVPRLGTAPPVDGHGGSGGAGARGLLSKGLALAARGLWPRAARTAPARGPPSARGAYGGPLFRRRTRCLSCKLSHTADSVAQGTSLGPRRPCA